MRFSKLKLALCVAFATAAHAGNSFISVPYKNRGSSFVIPQTTGLPNPTGVEIPLPTKFGSFDPIHTIGNGDYFNKRAGANKAVWVGVLMNNGTSSSSITPFHPLGSASISRLSFSQTPTPTSPPPPPQPNVGLYIQFEYSNYPMFYCDWHFYPVQLGPPQFFPCTEDYWNLPAPCTDDKGLSPPPFTPMDLPNIDMWNYKNCHYEPNTGANGAGQLTCPDPKSLKVDCIFDPLDHAPLHCAEDWRLIQPLVKCLWYEP
ncbi:hypothetical protein QBC46DRAFT_388876 [Diplogelasinospora grovesii]|uniref:Uncharacterized protein n=1 Tax=Diplogelasinospora grovesii TaxID=303347 RepID=A0AAN6N4P2_9PEZI|nr:hypothetical protein QBC46DRAFT_388876 [Diplogelasinospora grovesii]